MPWHLTSRCESCEFYAHCRAEAEASSSVSQIPGLSSGGRRYLREAPWDGGLPINALSDLTEFLRDPESDGYLDNCGSLAGQGDRLRATVRALSTGEIVSLAATSLALPVYEDIAVTLTLQKDPPVSGRVYALGFRRSRGKAVYGTPSHEAIYVAEDPPGDCTRVRREFVRALAAELAAVDDYNRGGRDWAGQESVQTYVYDTYEEELFTRLLEEALDDPRNGRGRSQAAVLLPGSRHRSRVEPPERVRPIPDRRPDKRDPAAARPSRPVHAPPARSPRGDPRLPVRVPPRSGLPLLERARQRHEERRHHHGVARGGPAGGSRLGPAGGFAPPARRGGERPRRTPRTDEGETRAVGGEVPVPGLVGGRDARDIPPPLHRGV
ncbi:hypothetical protein [Methanoculleus chikugoensis]|uniref:hypothetical protein n=1 Tax=Methanoculleus chikugoensis TaxID=118126 RepID=UPI0006D2A4B3|nr:hypothetical protein [Methanoculleus chikugoensis]